MAGRSALAIDGTGALLIADDAGNTVWRVASADGSVTPQPIPTDRLVSVDATNVGGAGTTNSQEARVGAGQYQSVEAFSVASRASHIAR